MWVHQKYGISWIIRKLYSVESNDCTYLTVHNNDGMNRWNDVTYDLKCTNGKIMTKITITHDHMSMLCSINM